MKKRSYKILILIFFLISTCQGIFILRILKPKAPKIIKHAPTVRVKPAKAIIAVVIDDCGYSLSDSDFLKDVKESFTLAILPNLPYTKTIAEMAHANNKEVILHLPLEPHSSETEYEKTPLEKDTILTEMAEKDVRAILSRDLESVSYAEGISNHMGSKATEDIALMTKIFQELKRRDIYFLDSLVSPNSICFDLAHKMNVKFAKRNVFLDNKDNPEYIIAQISKLANKARVFGYAIGIGHYRKNTLAILKKFLPKLEASGYRLVTVSELIDYAK